MNILSLLLSFSLIILSSIYVFRHIWLIMPFSSLYKWVLMGIMSISFISFFTNFIFGLDRYPFSISRFLYNVGSSSLFIALYLLMLFLVLDIAVWCNIIPRKYMYNSALGTGIVLILIVGIFVYGNIRYHKKERIELNIKTNKKINAPMRLVLLSDLHLGYHNTRSDFQQWIDLINAERPDAVLIAGDIIDGSIRALEVQHLDEMFKQIKAPIYACLGNHEYYANKLKAEAFYKRAGICLLRDSHTLLINNGGEQADSILLIGRDDVTNKKRKPLNDIMPKEYAKNFSILLDHQPHHLEKAMNANVDFQLSGHTHNGQVFPINIAVKMLYEKAHGYIKKNNTHFYISSGIGIWGGKFRIGTQSEYIVLNVIPSS